MHLTIENNFSSGRGNIIGRVEELKKMGDKANKQLGDKILMLEQ